MSSWRGAVAVIVGLTLVIELVMLVGDAGPAVGLIAALCVLIGVGTWCLSALLRVPIEPPDMPRPPPELSSRTDRRVTRLRNGLTYARHDDGSLASLRNDLVELVDDQLRSVHRVDRVSEPARARALVGPELATLLDDPKSARALGQPRRLDRILTLIEEL